MVQVALDPFLGGFICEQCEVDAHVTHARNQQTNAKHFAVLDDADGSGTVGVQTARGSQESYAVYGFGCDIARLSKSEFDNAVVDGFQGHGLLRHDESVLFRRPGFPG